MKYDKEGRELPDATPVSLTVKQRMSIDRFELVKQQILAAVAADRDFATEESFEESMDFQVDDDDMPLTRAELAELELEDLRRTARFVQERDEVEDVARRLPVSKPRSGDGAEPHAKRVEPPKAQEAPPKQGS